MKELLLILELGDVSFAIPLKSVREVLPLPLLYQPPGVPKILHGFLNLSGQALPVLNLRNLFGIKDSPPGLYSHLVVLRRQSAPVALLADRVVQAVEKTQDDILPVSRDHSFNGCVDGEVAVGAKAVCLLSVEKLLLKEEQARISELQAMEEERLRQLGNKSK